MGFQFGANTSNLTGPVQIINTFDGPYSGVSYPGFSAVLVAYHPSTGPQTAFIGNSVDLSESATTPTSAGSNCELIGYQADVRTLKDTGQTGANMTGARFTVRTKGPKCNLMLGVDSTVGTDAPNNAGGTVEANVFRAQIVKKTTTSGLSKAVAFHALTPDLTGGNVTEYYGLLVDDVSSATSNWAIRTGQGKVEFSDAVIAQTTMTIGSSLVSNGQANWHRTTFSNTSVAQAATDHILAQVGTLTAPQAIALVRANAVAAGHEFTVMDESGSVTGVNTLTLNRTGADTINGVASLVLNSAYAKVTLISDGVSRWTIRS